jgi:hypothetical protein
VALGSEEELDVVLGSAEGLGQLVGGHFYYLVVVVSVFGRVRGRRKVKRFLGLANLDIKGFESGASVCGQWTKVDEGGRARACRGRTKAESEGLANQTVVCEETR